MPDDDRSDSPTRLRHFVLAELRRLGTPQEVIQTRVAAAMRRETLLDASLPLHRRGQVLAQRETIFACIERVSEAVARALKARRIRDGGDDDATHDVLLRGADGGLLDGFEPATARRDDDAPDAVAWHERAIARYVGGFAWRMSFNERRKRHRRTSAAMRSDPALEPPETAPPDVATALAEVGARVREVLSQKDFEIWLRCDVEREPHDEVAATLGMVLASMETRLYRARVRIKEALADRDALALLPLPLAANADASERLADHLRELARPGAEDLRAARRTLERTLRPRLSLPRAWRDLSLVTVGAVAGIAATLALTHRAPTPRPVAQAAVTAHALTSPSEERTPPVVERLAPTAAVTQPSPPPTPLRAAPLVARRPPQPRALQASPESDLEVESAMIAAARSALGRSPPLAREALAALDEHARRFPQGQLSEPREFLRVRALDAAGRGDEARAAAARFRGAYPRSIYVARLP